MDITANGFKTTYTYTTDTTAGNALKTLVAQGSAQTRTFETDWLGRTTSVMQPESGTTTYSYAYSATAGYGLTVTRVRPQANQTGSTTTTTTTQYDSLGRVLSVNYSDNLTPNKQFVYDVNSYWTPTATNLKGRLAVMGAGSDLASHHTGSLFSYDTMGRVVGIWACAPATCGTGYQTARPLSFAYDWAGNLTQESDGASGNINYGRSIAGEVTSITNSTYTNLPYNPPNLVSSVVNGPDGPVSYTLGNGLNVYRSYDTMGRFSGQWVCNGPAAENCSGGTVVYGTANQWKGSQLQLLADTVLGQHITNGYDSLNRLISRTVTFGTVQNYTYTYDQYGNRLTQTPLQGGYTFDPTINSANNRITTSGFTYDAAGNMTNDTVHSYTYDAEGNILQVDGGSTAIYVYDALNQRVHVQTASATNEYVYDFAGRRISTWLSPNNHGNEGQIYWGGQQIGFRSTDGTTYFDHQDTLGTERMRTNYGGTAGSSYTSLPWGDAYTATVNNSGADQDNLHFAGLERDAESDTEHAQFRNYASAQGRWLAPDPYMGSYDFTNPQSFNRYAYALNNPASSIDPSGLVVICNERGCYDCDSNDTACASTGDCVASGTEGCITPENPGNTTTLQTTPSYPSSGGGGAPNNGMPKTPQQCAGEALKKNALALGLDAAAFIPGESLAAAGVRMGVAVTATVNSAVHQDVGGSLLGIGSFQIEPVAQAAKYAGVGFAESIPVIGQFISGAAAVNDLYGTYKDYQACLAGHE